MVHVEISRPDPDDEPGYRAPPHNEEAEQALLGAVLVNNDVLHKVEDFLRAEHFYIPVHQRIFEAIRLVIEKTQIANPITLKAYFENDEALEQVGGAGYLARLAAGATTIINASQYAHRIREHYVDRQMIGIGEDMVNDAYQPTVDRSAEDRIDHAEKKLFELAEFGRYDSGFRSFKEVSIEALGEVQEAFERDGNLAGLSTGSGDLDDVVGGLSPSDLIVLAGRPSMGKTAFVTHIALGIARKRSADANPNGEAGGADEPVVGMFSLEMSAKQLVDRILSDQSKVKLTLMRQGNIEAREFEHLVQASTALAPIPLYIDDTPAIPIHTLRARARRLKRQKHGLALVVVDYLQLVRPSGRGNNESRVQEVTEITQSLKALAKELDVPVIACSQLSRAVEQRDDKRPQLSDLRESGSIEQDADIVMFLYRHEYYLERLRPQPKVDEDEDDPGFRGRLETWQKQMEENEGVMEVIVAKHRHGSIGTAELHFDKRTASFRDLERRYS